MDNPMLLDVPPVQVEVGQVWRAKVQGAQEPDLLADLVGKRREVEGRRTRRGLGLGIAALEAVLHLRTGKLMQHRLHHRELVQVGVEKTGDDHGKGVGPTATAVPAVYENVTMRDVKAPATPGRHNLQPWAPLQHRWPRN